jgi:apolipoprotein D and lipocalin family protein
VDRVDVDRFMGDWYVIAHIPLAPEADAYNAVESYARGEGDAIQTVYRFRDGGFDGELEVYRPKGWIADAGSDAEWRMQFLWPFRSAYLIAWVDDEYSETIVGVPDRDYAWIMTREPDVSEERYDALVARLSSLGYDPARLRRVPHRWPEAAADPPDSRR